MFGGRTNCIYLARRHLASQWNKGRQLRVTLVGAAGGIGQPLALLLMGNRRIRELVLHDVVNTLGVAKDLSHISTPVAVKGYVGEDTICEAVKCSDVVLITAGIARKPGMTREQLFEINAKVLENVIVAIAENSPQALIAVVTNPVNTVVPMAAEILKQRNVFDPLRLFGVTTLDVVRAERFIGDSMKMDPSRVKIPVIGGHAGTTILPITSQCEPMLKGDKKSTAALIKRIQFGGEEVIEAKGGKGSATLSMAFAAYRFADTIIKGLLGEKAPIEPAYVCSSVTEAPFFATPLSYGKNGIEKNHGLPPLSKDEECALEIAVEQLIKSAEAGVKQAKN